MKKNLLIIFGLLILSINGFSQVENNTAPVKWENYKINSKNLTVMFPKIPVKQVFDDRCSQIVTTKFYAYAAEIVYEFDVHEKVDRKFPGYCSNTEKYSNKSFSKYLNASQTSFSNAEILERGAIKFSTFNKTIDTIKISKWLFEDEKNFRWFEFTITSRTKAETKADKFIDSIKFSAEPTTIGINDGSPVLLGDADENNHSEEEIGDGDKESRNDPLTVVFKPRPIYTDKARREDVSGEVRLRVTFTPNGSVGNIDLVSGLKYGLNEEAVTAARKLAFLPSKKNGKKVFLVKTVVFRFILY